MYWLTLIGLFGHNAWRDFAFGYARKINTATNYSHFFFFFFFFFKLSKKNIYLFFFFMVMVNLGSTDDSRYTGYREITDRDVLDLQCTVNSRYLEVQGTLWNFEILEISVPWHIRFAELRKKVNRTTTFHKWICNLTPEVTDILKLLWKSNFSSFP